MHLCDINNIILFASDGYEFDICQEIEFSGMICSFPRKLSRKVPFLISHINVSLDKKNATYFRKQNVTTIMEKKNCSFAAFSGQRKFFSYPCPDLLRLPRWTDPSPTCMGIEISSCSASACY